MQISRDHHTVPRLLLRGFIHKKTKQLLARKRDGSENLVSLNDATVVPDFYNIGDGQAPDATLEDWFSNSIESPVGETMGALRKGALPTGPARSTVATFVALQMVRTMRFRGLMGELSESLGPMLFANEVLQRVVAECPELKDSGADLTAWHAEIAACAPEAVRSPEPLGVLRSMAREADRLKPMLQGMHWSVLIADGRLLMTGDTPVVAVSPTGETNTGPMLLPEMYMVQVPVTPTVLLTISPFPSFGKGTLTPVEAAQVNQAVIRDCATTVLRHPDMPWPADLVLPAKRAPLNRPTVKVTASGGKPTVPTWPPIVDNAIAEVIAMLGGDPELNEW